MIGRLAIATIALIVVGCSGAATPTSAPSTTVATPVPLPTETVVVTQTPAAPTAVPTQAPLAGLIAMGHSGLTGEGTGVFQEARPENSWATGSNAAVDSVYLRMLAAHPETQDRVANTAHGGAYAAELWGMTKTALEAVPRPALAIISTIDNDIRCDGTDVAHVPEFGASLKKALDAITAPSPDTKILVVGQLGRPSIPFIETLLEHDPSVRPALTGAAMCDFLGADGKPVPAHFKALTAIIDAYEAEQATVCATVPNCVTDGGVRAAYQDTIENFSPDWAHLNVRGQAAEAELIWPVVREALGW